MPPSRSGIARSLSTPLTDRLRHDPGVDPREVGLRFVAVVRTGGGHQGLPFTGESAGLVHDVAPAP